MLKGKSSGKPKRKGVYSMRSTCIKYIYRFSCYGDMRDRIEAKEKEEGKEVGAKRKAYSSRAAAR